MIVDSMIIVPGYLATDDLCRGNDLKTALPNLDEPGPKKSYSLSHLSAYEKEKHVAIKLLVIKKLSIASK